VSRRTAPPSGWPPPSRAVLGGAEVALEPLAEKIADRYFARFPEDLGRYGDDVARAWELHDTCHVLSWAIGTVEGHGDLDGQVRWLARILEARDFSLEHLAANLELAGDVVAERLEGGAAVADGLRAAAAMVRGTPSFL
jgi:hypothetical protein